MSEARKRSIVQVLINGVTSQVRISTSAFGVGRYYEEPFRFCDLPGPSGQSHVEAGGAEIFSENLQGHKARGEYIIQVRTFVALNPGCRSIRAKALSRDTSSSPCFAAPLGVRVVEDRSSETLTVNQLSAVRPTSIVPPTIDTAKTSTMILLSESRCKPGRERPINPSV